MPHLGTARADAGAGVQLQLEEPVGGRRINLLEFLFPAIPWRGEKPTGHRLPPGLGTTRGQSIAVGVGWAAGTSQQAGSRFPSELGRLDRVGVLTGLCAGTQPGRIHLGLLEAARVTECVPEGLLAVG